MKKDEIKSQYKNDEKDQIKITHQKLELIENKVFTPRTTKIDLTKKNNEIIGSYLNKFPTSERVKEEMNKHLNTTNLGLLTNRSHFEQLERLKMTLYNRKLEEK